MENLKGVTIDGNIFVINLNEIENNSDFAMKLEEMRVEFLMDNATSLNAFIEGYGIEVEFEGLTELSVNTAPEDMTIKELRDYTDKVAAQRELKNKLNELFLNVPLLSANGFNTLFRRLYPKLTEQDLMNIHETLRKLGYCYSQTIQNIEYFIDLILATKEQTGL